MGSNLLWQTIRHTDWKVSVDFQSRTLKISNLKNPKEHQQLLDKHLEEIALWAYRVGCQQALIGNYLEIPVEMVTTSTNEAEGDRVIVQPERTLISSPRSRTEELEIEAKSAPNPVGFASLRNGKILYMNPKMPSFTGLPFDEIAPPDIREQFQSRSGLQPDDLDAFNSRLEQDGVINGFLTAFRTNGDFGRFWGKFSKEIYNGVPIRRSEYHHFELLQACC
ncbi:MAG: hypothetical protein KME06_09675 [Kastovskya adunca ATA6-11-RM4]|jgi:hypothetical protein|nr:hypothetical protein [Kastovskya adunca ATA6-11-RM4]